MIQNFKSWLHVALMDLPIRFSLQPIFMLAECDHTSDGQ